MSEEHVSDEEVEGAISEDEVSAEVADEIGEAKDAHKDQASEPGATEGQGVEPEVMGHAEPDTGQGEVAESEVPEGVDALTDEQIQAAQERGGGDDDDDGDSGALDMSEIMAEGGDDAGAADDAGDDTTEMTDADAQVAPDTGEDT